MENVKIICPTCKSADTVTVTDRRNTRACLNCGSRYDSRIVFIPVPTMS